MNKKIVHIFNYFNTNKLLNYTENKNTTNEEIKTHEQISKQKDTNDSSSSIKEINTDKEIYTDEEIYNKIIIENIVDNIIDKIINDETNHREEYYNNIENEKYKIPFPVINEYFIEKLLKNNFKLKHYDEFKYILKKIHKGFKLDKFTNIKYYDKKNKINGIFQTNNFIIRINNDIDDFNGENDVMTLLGGGINKEYNTVLPFYIKINIPLYSEYHYSIQPYIKNSYNLHEWFYYEKGIHGKFLNHNIIKLCISICKNIQGLHNKNLVHGDIKPDNILIKVKKGEIKTYLIDFGLSGKQHKTKGTGGTKPFCHPCMNNYKEDKGNKYNYYKITKENDIWSIALIFLTLICFRRLYYYYSDYPIDFFNNDGYVNILYTYNVPSICKEAFKYVFHQSEPVISIDTFIDLLTQGLSQRQPYL